MNQLDAERMADHIYVRMKNKQTVFVCGNGGSAATAEHLTNDLFSKGVKAICLNSNVSIVTMIANDFGYNHVFSKQLEVFAEGGDLLIAISTSGLSLNILNAIRTAEVMHVKVAKMFGDDYGKIQDMENEHLRLAHKIAESL
jgi:D-sedoheptulose 7-phosphate isomerase